MASETDVVETGTGDILAEGTRIAGRYTIEKHLAAGGMGRVYVATQAPLGRKVALKVMHRDLCQDRESVRRFFNEAVAVSQLTHPNTITVFDYGESDDGNFYIAMEFLEGEPLSDRIARQGRIEAETAVNIVIQVARSLSEAHRKGIIHRDLKPENVFLGNVEKDLVKVLDFGIAKILQQETNDGTKLTRMGFVCGTPEYMSPEQARGEDLDGRSDLYALGVMLYEVLTGQPPFMESTPLATVLKHQNDTVPPLPDTIPRPLSTFILKRALAKEREDRPPSAELFVEELEVAAVQSGYLMDTTGSMPASELRRAIAQQNSVETAALVSGGFDAPHSGRVTPVSSPTETAYPGTAPDRRSWLVPVLAGLSALAVVAVAGILLLGGSESSEKAEAATATEPTAEPATTDDDETATAPVDTALAGTAADDEAAAAPVRAEVTLVINSELEGVEVFDEAGARLGELGPEPFELQTAPGQTQRELTFRKAGYVAATQTLDIPVNDSGDSLRVDVDVALEALPTATVTSDPEGATVFLGEEPLGTTPLELPFEPGQIVALRFELDGYREASLDASPRKPGQVLSVNLKKGKERDGRSGRDRPRTGHDPKTDAAPDTTDSGTKDKPKDDPKPVDSGSTYKPFGN